MQKANTGMVRDTTMLYTSGIYARITPSAEDCTIDKKQDILPIDSVGSEVSFTITPQKADEIEVSAVIEMFDNEDCLGAPFRKNSTQVLRVKVKVDYWGEIWNPVWKYFKPFWISFVALFFGALLFVIRKFLFECLYIGLLLKVGIADCEFFLEQACIGFLFKCIDFLIERC